MKIYCVSSKMPQVFTEGIEYSAEYTGGGCNVRSRYDSVFYARFNDETGYFEVGSDNGNDLVEFE